MDQNPPNVQFITRYTEKTLHYDTILLSRLENICILHWNQCIVTTYTVLEMCIKMVYLCPVEI